MAGDIRVTFDQAAIKLTCASPSSDVGRAMSLLADGLVQIMKRECPVAPVSTPPTRRNPAGRRSGTLRSSIRKFRQPDGSYLVGPTDLTADGQFLGPLITRGTRPHTITSHGPWSLHSPVTDRYYGRIVHHPGTRPDDFVGRAAALMNGTRIRVR